MNKAQAVPLSVYLQSRRMSQAELARLIGVAPNTVYRWLEGSRRPGWKTLTRLAEITGGAVTADSFLSRQAA